MELPALTRRTKSIFAATNSAEEVGRSVPRPPSSLEDSRIAKEISGGAGTDSPTDKAQAQPPITTEHQQRIIWCSGTRACAHVQRRVAVACSACSVLSLPAHTKMLSTTDGTDAHG